MRTRPDVVTSEFVGGHTIYRDEAGYLLDPDEWDETVATRFAAEEGVKLGDEHWVVRRFMRQYFVDHGIAADARFVFRHLAERHGEGAGERPPALFRPVSLWIRQAGVQDRRHAPAPRLEHRVRAGAKSTAHCAAKEKAGHDGPASSQLF